MKGNQKLIDMLNKLLADELTAVNQYMVHAEMDENWGYGKLNGSVEKRAIQEMKHAEKLIARILFLEGTPIVSSLNDIRIGADVPKQIDSDLAAEHNAWKAYNEAVKLAADVGDNATKELLESILADEDKHIDTLEEYKDQMTQMGVQLFLSTQVEG
ncbi:bacterioferritin [Treponema brennaborense]|uniref:Bacterioferritin n=1 Tax=Treponema brennaborense (strain DSM 12168 / CIP 105900 / DD5/3) TaxID=906968 RepID=F4LLE5_TREBD|nr:bacterioferritin [Treponema brennaborense]AEE15623.1 bacterioferritin [Treponema brennaborense DSM 12168]